MNEDERAIRDLVAKWMAASQAGDTQTVLSLMTDDVEFLVPGREPFGKAAFAAAAQDMQGVHMEGRSEVRELESARRLGLPARLSAGRNDAARRQ